MKQGRKKKIIIWTIMVVFLLSTAVTVSISLIDKDNRYKQALSLYREGEYGKAKEILIDLNDYRDSRSLMITCTTAIRNIETDLEAQALLNDGKPEEALTLLNRINPWSKLIYNCKQAIELAEFHRMIDEKQYEQAEWKWADLCATNNQTQDLSTEEIAALHELCDKGPLLDRADEELRNGNYVAAFTLFSEVGDTQKAIDVVERLIQDNKYDVAVSCYVEEGNTVEAAKIASRAIDNGRYKDAFSCYVELGDMDSAAAAQVLWFQQGWDALKGELKRGEWEEPLDRLRQKVKDRVKGAQDLQDTIYRMAKDECVMQIGAKPDVAYSLLEPMLGVFEEHAEEIDSLMADCVSEPPETGIIWRKHEDISGGVKLRVINNSAREGVVLYIIEETEGLLLTVYVAPQKEIQVSYPASYYIVNISSGAVWFGNQLYGEDASIQFVSIEKMMRDPKDTGILFTYKDHSGEYMEGGYTLKLA